MALASLNKLIAIAVISLIVAAATAQFDNSRERCRHEMQESQLRSCKQFMMQRGRDTDMVMSFTNYEMRERCCRELRDISPQCRCDAIEEMMSNMREEMEEQRYRHGGHMSCRKMMEMAERLPSMCHVSPGYCHMRERLMYRKLV